MTAIEFLKKCNNEKPVDPPPHLISEYMQGLRVMPPGSPRPGPIDLFYTPYAIKILDSLGPYSGINRISVMKGVQIALTTLLENAMLYGIGGNPCEQMYCTATDALLKKWIKRLEPAIHSCGLRDLMVASGNANSKSKRTGDSMYSKEYPGGSLSMASLQAPSTMHSESNQKLYIDEVDRAKKETTTGEGNFLGILEGRTAAYGSTWKIISTSTPALMENSIIYPDFLAGDQQYYNVPCLNAGCGAYFVFDFNLIRPIYDKHGYLEKVFHECPHCNKEIWNHQKTEMMRIDNAEWRATAIPQEKNHASFHISALYSPVGMLSWDRIYGIYLKAEEDPTLKPSFANLYKGWPFKQEGYRPDKDKVQALSGDYKEGIVPEGVIILTLGGDVQLGKEKYQKMSQEELTVEIEKIRTERGELALWKSGIPRIEVEILGTGKFHKTWSIDYKVFYGHTTLGSYAGAYKEIDDWSINDGMTYYSADGLPFNVMRAVIDASEGKTAHSVFNLCSRWRGSFPTVNKDFLKKNKDHEVDERSGLSYDRFRVNGAGNKPCPYLNTSSNHYKMKLYAAINISIGSAVKSGVNTPYEFCAFPMKRHSHYYKMLTAEELLDDDSFHNGGRPAEALDCRVYADVAADTWIENQINLEKDMLKKKHKDRISPDDLNRVNGIYILDKFERLNNEAADKMGLVK